MNTVTGIISKNTQYEIGDVKARAEKLNISDLPTSLSAFLNDIGLIDKTVNDLVNYYTKSETYTKSEVDSILATKWNSQFVQELPTEHISTTTIYFVPRSQGEQEENDTYNEYIYANGQWELIGNTYVDLSDYYTKSEADSKINEIVGDESVRALNAENTLRESINTTNDNLSTTNTNLANETLARQQLGVTVGDNYTTLDGKIDNEITRASNAENGLGARILVTEGHLTDETNPHNVTKSQVGLGNVTNVATTDTITNNSNENITSGAVYTALENKVDKVQGKGLSDENYTLTEKTKLAGLSNYDDTTLSGRVTATENAITTLNGNSSVNGSVDKKIADAIAGITQFSFSIVQELPASGSAGVIYLVPKTSTESTDEYDEYIWVNNSFELIGTKVVEVDLSDYYNKASVNALVSVKNDKITIEDDNITLSDNDVILSANSGQNPTSVKRHTLTKLVTYLDAKFPFEINSNVDWSQISYLGDGAQGGALTNKYKASVVNGSVVNIQAKNSKSAIYFTFETAITSCDITLDSNGYTIEGAGIWVYIDNFLRQETKFTITTNDNVKHTIFVYFADGYNEKATFTSQREHRKIVKDINDINTTLSGKQNTLTFDSTPTSGSSNPVTSGGIKTELDKKVDETNSVTIVDGTDVYVNQHNINADDDNALVEIENTSNKSSVISGQSGTVTTKSKITMDSKNAKVKIESKYQSNQYTTNNPNIEIDSVNNTINLTASNVKINNEQIDTVANRITALSNYIKKKDYDNIDWSNIAFITNAYTGEYNDKYKIKFLDEISGITTTFYRYNTSVSSILVDLQLYTNTSSDVLNCDITDNDSGYYHPSGMGTNQLIIRLELFTRKETYFNLILNGTKYRVVVYYVNGIENDLSVPTLSEFRTLIEEVKTIVRPSEQSFTFGSTEYSDTGINTYKSAIRTYLSKKFPNAGITPYANTGWFPVQGRTSDGRAIIALCINKNSNGGTDNVGQSGVYLAGSNTFEWLAKSTVKPITLYN